MKQVEKAKPTHARGNSSRTSNAPGTVGGSVDYGTGYDSELDAGALDRKSVV